MGKNNSTKAFSLKGLIEQYKNMATPVKASLWFVVCNLIQSGIGVISVPIFARMLSTEEYGMFNTFYAWRNILMIFTSLNLSYGVFNNAMVKYEDSKTRDEYVSSMEGLYGLITLVVFGIYWITRSWCNEFLGMTTEVVCLLFVELLCYPALLFWSNRQRYEFKYKWLVIVTLLVSVVNLASGVILVYFSENKDLARIRSVALTDGLICGGFFIYQMIKGRKVCAPKFWKFALAFNIPLIPHYLSEMVLTQSDRIMIEKYVSATATANYSTAYSVATMLQLFMSAINASFLPWAYDCLKHKKYNDMKKMGVIITAIMCGLIILMMLFAPELIYIFAGKKYAGAIYVIPPIAMSVFFMLMYDFFSTIEFYYGKTVLVMIASVVSAGMNVLLNWLLIPKFGYYVAGYTTLFCYLLYSLTHYALYRRICKSEMGGNRCYNEKILFLIGAAMLAMTILINIVYRYIIIRYLIVILVVVIFVWRKDAIINLFKQMKEKK